MKQYFGNIIQILYRLYRFMHTLWNKGPISIEPHTRKLVTILTIAIQSFCFQSLLFTHNCRIALSSDNM